jgi:uncharacterized coiled-coil DUF342 family protein
MNQEDIKKLEEERQQIIQQVNQLDNTKNQLITRLAEIQGVLKYLNDKEKETKKEK